MTIAEFLLARIADDEEIAYANLEPPPGYKPRPEDHPLILSANRLLAECEAKRRIVDLWEHLPTWGGTEKSITRRNALRDVLLLLALPYAGHEQYDESWRP